MLHFRTYLHFVKAALTLFWPCPSLSCFRLDGFPEVVGDTAEVEIKREIEGYKAEPEVSKDEGDIMPWWKKNRIKYPNLVLVHSIRN